MATEATVVRSTTLHSENQPKAAICPASLWRDSPKQSLPKAHTT